MSDLIKRLREADSNGRLSIGDLWNLCEEAADALEQQQWIPVSELPPIDGEECLFAFRHNKDERYTIGVGPYFSDEEYVSDCYWMLLPPPPEDGLLIPQPPTAEDG